MDLSAFTFNKLKLSIINELLALLDQVRLFAVRPVLVEPFDYHFLKEISQCKISNYQHKEDFTEMHVQIYQTKEIFAEAVKEEDQIGLVCTHED